jgi:nicotinamidase-related amidase
LLTLLHEHHIEEVVIVGLALDYCVGATAMDAVRAGLKVTVIEEGTKFVREESGEEMVKKFGSNGIKFISYKDFMKSLEMQSN